MHLEVLDESVKEETLCKRMTAQGERALVKLNGLR